MPSAHEIDYKIVGDDMQALLVTLDPGEAVQAEAGALMFMEEGISIYTGTGGGSMKGVKRILAGESFFFITTFAAPFPGKILSIDLGETGPMLCQRNAYLCSAYGIEYVGDLKTAFFGGLGGLTGGDRGFKTPRTLDRGKRGARQGGGGCSTRTRLKRPRSSSASSRAR